MIKTIFLGVFGILISVFIISVAGVILPFSNYHQPSVSTLIYVGLLGPTIEELLRTSFSKKIGEVSFVLAVTFGFSWGVTEGFILIFQGTKYFTNSIIDFYNSQIIASQIGTILMHISCAVIVIFNKKNLLKAFFYALLLHSIHNLSSIIHNHYMDFSYAEKIVKIVIYFSLLCYLKMKWSDNAYRLE